MSEIIVTALAGFAIVLLSMIFFPLLIGCAAAAGAYIYGYWFPETSAVMLQYIHFPGPIWQLGMVLGFIGSYFRSTSYSKK